MGLISSQALGTMLLRSSTSAVLVRVCQCFHGAAGVQDEVVFGVGMFDKGFARNEVEFGAAIGGGKDAVAIERFPAPLETIGIIDLLPGICCSRTCVRQRRATIPGRHREGSASWGKARCELLIFRPGRGRYRSRDGFTGRRDGGVGLGDAPLGVGVGAFLLSPDGGRQNEVREVTSMSGVEAVLHNKELQRLEGLLKELVVGEGDGRVGGDEPEGL
jgi:hypothetical protein